MTQPTSISADQQFAQVKAEIDQRYPTGRFVAIQSGRIVTNAPTHRLLVDELKSRQLSPKDMLIVEAGIQYPQSATIFACYPSNG